MMLNITKLKSGLTILTYKMHDIKSVAMNLIVTVGSKFESLEENGISHFLEHMAFKGTKTRSARQIAEEFDSIGGHFNAYTSKERTVYYAKVLSENTHTALDIIADIIQNSTYDAADIKKEYEVICQEIAQTLDNPDDLAYEKLYEVAYKDQSFGRTILGTSENIAKFTTESFKKYVDAHYHSENMFLSIAGDVEHDAIVKMANDLFDIKKQSIITASSTKYLSGSTIIAKPNLEHSTIIMAYESVPYMQKERFYHAQILSLILGGGMSSRLFQKIREEMGLSYSVGAYNSSYSDTGLFSLYAGTSHENLSKVKELLLSEAHKIISDISFEELARAKAQIKASIIMAEEKPAYKSEEIGKSYSIFGECEGPEKIMAYINNSSEKDIMKIAEEIFSNKMSISVVSDNEERVGLV